MGSERKATGGWVCCARAGSKSTRKPIQSWSALATWKFPLSDLLSGARVSAGVGAAFAGPIRIRVGVAVAIAAACWLGVMVPGLGP